MKNVTMRKTLTYHVYQSVVTGREATEMDILMTRERIT
jgi:hypothetical protein